MTTPDQRERILKKAYEIWEAEGRPSGRDMEHWVQAEVALAAKKANPKSKTKPKAKAKAKPAAKAKAKPKAKAKAKTTTRKAPSKK